MVILGLRYGCEKCTWGDRDKRRVKMAEVWTLGPLSGMYVVCLKNVSKMRE